jgi:TonB family protein
MPKPRYPLDLQLSGRCGYANVKYVVGLDGRVEPETITIVGATDPSFGESAAEVIRKSRFSAALLGGKPVRQRVDQRINFKVAGSC